MFDTANQKQKIGAAGAAAGAAAMFSASVQLDGAFSDGLLLLGGLTLAGSLLIFASVYLD
jgi:hypothetical protein